MKSDFSFASHITKKYSLFHTLLATLIGGDSKVGWIEILFKVIAELQMFGMLLVLPFEFLDTSMSDTLGDFVKSIAQILSFNNILVFDSDSILTSIFLGIVLFYMLALMLYLVAFVVSHYLKYTIPLSYIQVWINLCVVHFTFLFLYIQECSMGLIKAGSDDKAYLFGISGSGALFLWLGIVITVMNIIFAALTSKFVYEPIKSKYIAAMRTTSPDFLLVFAKALNVPFRLFITDLQTQKWIRLVLLVLTIGYRVKIYLYSTPYYYFNPMRLFQGCVFIEFGLVLLNLIMTIIYEGKQVRGFAVIYMALVLSIFFEKLSDVLLFSMIRKYGLKDINEIKDKDSFYKKLFATDYILEMGSISAIIEKKQREGVTEFLYYGVIKAHKNTCTKEICGCNLVLEKGPMSEGVPIKEDQRRIMRDFKFELIADLFASFDHPEIKVTLANYLFENKVQAYAAAITIIHNLNLDQTTIELRVIRAKLLEKIEDKVLSNYDSSVDTQQIVDYQRLSYDLKKSIEKNLAKFIGFWDSYRGAEPNVNELYKTSILINQEADDISKIWSAITGKYAKLSYQDHLVYGLYQSLVRSAPYSAEKVLQKFFSLSSIYSTQKNKNPMVTPDNVFEPQNILVYILMNKEQLGNVVFVTPNIEASLQYTAEEVLGKNVNTLMPGFYKERHNSILLAHIEKSRSSIINRNRSLFAQKKNGYVTPVTLYVSIFPYFQKQLIYIGILRPVQTFDEFILVLPNGTIDAFSENIAHMLNLTSDKTRNYQLKTICKELDSYVKAFEYLKAGDRDKLRTIALSRKTHTTTSGKATKQFQSESSYSQSQKHTFIKKTTNFEGPGVGDAEPIKDLFQDQEFDDWVRLYELFTSTGVSIVFNKFVEKGGKAQKKGIEFNTIMIEEVAHGSKLNIFRLQSVSAGAAEDDEDEEQNFDEDEEQSREKSDHDRSLQPAMIIETLKERMKKKPDRINTEAKAEDAPGSMGFLKTENLETEEIELLSGGDSKTPKTLTKLKNAVKKEASKKKILAENDEEFDVPDDNDVSPVNMDVMKNPLIARMISNSLLQSQGSDKYLVEGRREIGTPLGLVPEKNEQQSPLTPLETDQDFLDQTPTNPAQLGLSSIRRQGSIGSGWRGDVTDIAQRSLNVMKSMKERSNDGLSSAGKSSDHEDEKEPEHKQKLKRFFHANRLLALDGGAGINVDGQDRSSVSSSTRSARISAKVERAVYTNMSDITIKALNVLVGIFCVAGIGMIIYYLATANSNLNRLRANVEVQKYSTQRLYLIVEINRRARIINIIERGLSPPDRTTSDDTVSNLAALLPLADELSSYNNEIRLSINKIDKTEQQRFYEKIPVKERENPTSIRYINSFDTCTELVNCVFRLNSLTTRPAADNPDLVFILGNTLNDLVLSNEDVANILLDDNQISLSRVETTVLVLMILTVAIAICIFVFAVRSELQFIRRKTSFLDSFLRIKEYEIEGTLSIVQNFKLALHENNREDKFMQKIVDSNSNPHNVQSERNKKAENKKEHRSFKAKSANKRELHQSSYINMGLVLSFVLAFTAIFAILLGIFISYESSINKLMLRVINTNMNLFQLGLVFSSLYEYISENATTMIRNLPIGPEWERTYQILTGSSDFFSSFDDQSEEFDNKVLALLSGNLCLSIFTDSRCQSSVSNVATSGILGINTFILKGLRGIKDLYDNSEGALVQRQTAALTTQDFIDVEQVYSLYTSDSYKALDTLLTNQFFLEIDEFLKRSLIMGLISIVGMIALGRIVWMKAVRRMEEERNAFRSIMRVIPVNIIMGNRYLKSYLMRNSDKVLDSIKNKI